MAKKPLDVETITHDATRKNIPTAEFESLMRDQDKTPIQLAYARRNPDLDPQLVWRGKDLSDWSDLIVQAPPLYIQEKVHPKVIIDDLKRASKARAEAKAAAEAPMFDLFADFNGLPDMEAKTEFYEHDQHWSNRMISGDSLSVMASLAEREGLRGQVQCIYFDPPYGIKFNSNFQWSTTSRDVKDGDKSHITREPEQVRAFRDTWRDGIHSYLTYLRDRLTVARDLLSESGSIFVQISDENVHRVRAVMDEVFGDENFVRLITFVKTTGQTDNLLASVSDYLVWYAKDRSKIKYRQQFKLKTLGGEGALAYTKALFPNGERVPIGAISDIDKAILEGAKPYTTSDLTSQSPGTRYEVKLEGRSFSPKGYWKTEQASFPKLQRANRIELVGNNLRYQRFFQDYPAFPANDNWSDTGVAGFTADKTYVVQTSPKVIERCILMTTDPGDLVLDPTCGSGTTAYVAEQWGRRWITIDTSRVAVALARSRLMGARYPYYLLADSKEGQEKEAQITRTIPKQSATFGSIRQGFVYDRVPHITLKSIANNAEIDVIWDRMQPAVEEALAALNAALRADPQPIIIATGARAGHKMTFTAPGTVTLPSGETAPADGLMEWEVPRDLPLVSSHASSHKEDGRKTDKRRCLEAFWEARIARQREIDASIAAKAEFEFLYDKPFEDKSKVRVAGPFTVESLSPHRTLAVDWDDELIDLHAASEKRHKAEGTDFAGMILENLRTAGVQQAHREDRITFTTLKPWPGDHIAAEGVFNEGDVTRRAGIMIGPEFGTVSRPDLVAAAREAGDAGFDVLIACAFNFDAHSAEFDKLGRIKVLKARMNPDLHMARDLKATGSGNLFVIFGEPDIRIETLPGDMLRVQVFGVDVFKPQSGEVISEGTDGIALWMLDTDYNEESFFVRHAYFLGANDPYKALKTTLKAEIDEEAWETLNCDTSRPFPRPKSGRIAVKVINHLGDEVMKVFGV